MIVKKYKRARVGAAKGQGGYFDFDFEDIAVMAAGGLAVKALINPLAKIIFKCFFDIDGMRIMAFDKIAVIAVHRSYQF